MSEYIDYVKGGDILMAPCVQFKHRYILKCSHCKEYFTEFEQFFIHYLCHKDEKYCEEEEVDALYPLCGKVEVIDDNEPRKKEDILSNNSALKYACVDEDLEDDALMSTEKVYIKEEATFQEAIDSELDNNVIQTDSLCVESSSNSGPNTGKNIIMETEAPFSKDVDLTKCVRDFMRNTGYATTLIEAYKAQPLLWNVNYLPTRRAKERQNCLQEIVNVLKNYKNVTLACNEVWAIIVYMRQKYRENLGNTKSSKDKNLSYLKHLDFLKPFIEDSPIVVISEERPHLKPEQVTQIFNIYKNFPHLWDSDLIEYVCTNKRNESIERMLNVINKEMNLELDQSLLENYLTSIHAYGTKEKRRVVNAIKSTETRPVYSEHIKFIYNHVAPFKCRTCLRDFRNPLYFKQHLITHDDTKSLKCSECGKEYKTVELYTEHVKRHMNDMTKECKVCGKKFIKTRALTYHMRTHTGDKPYVCDICGNAYRQIQTFKEHTRSHNKEYVHFCPVCSKGFYTRSTMKVHIATHGTERNHVCDVCNKAFKNKINLTHHKWTHEDGCHPCDLCGKTYKNKYSLYQHNKIHRKVNEVT